MPLEVPEYNAGNKQGSPLAEPLNANLNYDSVTTYAQMINLVWSLVRLTDTPEQSVSSWTGFNMMTRDNVTVNKDIV